MRLSSLARYGVPAELLSTVVPTYDDGHQVHGVKSCSETRGSVRTLGTRLYDVVASARLCEECGSYVLRGAGEVVDLWVECDRLAQVEEDVAAASELDEVERHALLEAAEIQCEYTIALLPYTSTQLDELGENLRERVRESRERLQAESERLLVERCATRAAAARREDAATRLLGARRGGEEEALERGVAEAWSLARREGKSAEGAWEAMERTFEEGRSEVPETHQLTGGAVLAPEEGESLLSYVKRSWERDAAAKLGELHAAWERERRELLEEEGWYFVMTTGTRHERGAELIAALQVYPSVTSSGKTALHAPAAVAAWLEASRQGDRGGRGGPRDGEELGRLLEAAAGLWDPDGDGALKDAASAVDAARKVLGDRSGQAR